MSSVPGLNDAQEKELISRLDQISSPDYQFPETFGRKDWTVWIIVEIILLIMFCLPMLSY